MAYFVGLVIDLLLTDHDALWGEMLCPWRYVDAQYQTSRGSGKSGIHSGYPVFAVKMPWTRSALTRRTSRFYSTAVSWRPLRAADAEPHQHFMPRRWPQGHGDFVEWSGPEKIEVDRFPVAVSQSDGGAAVEHQAKIDGRSEQRPE